MSEKIIERWECRTCGDEYPCVIEIHAAANEYEHLIIPDRFKRKVCICRESLNPEWVPVESDNVKSLKPLIGMTFKRVTEGDDA